jgi:hypothetical protein
MSLAKEPDPERICRNGSQKQSGQNYCNHLVTFYEAKDLLGLVRYDHLILCVGNTVLYMPNKKVIMYIHYCPECNGAFM